MHVRPCRRPFGGHPGGCGRRPQEASGATEAPVVFLLALAFARWLRSRALDRTAALPPARGWPQTSVLTLLGLISFPLGSQRASLAGP